MAATLKLSQVHLGDSADQTKNFVLSVPDVPDGTLTIKRGDGTIVAYYGPAGSVTQLTDKNTAVTLNAIRGRIVLSSTALAANTSAFFVINNSQVGPYDAVLVSIVGASVANSASYLLTTTVGGGAFGVHIRNVTGSPLSEGVVLNFSVIKGSVI